MNSMDIQDYYPYQGGELLAKIRSLPRDILDQQLNQFNHQYALICQRLEAIYSPDRLDVFAAIRPGDLAEIDKAIAQCSPDQKKELVLLRSFRELNRVLLPFVDVFEANQLDDLKYLGRGELETFLGHLSEQLDATQKTLGQKDAHFRDQQNASGTLRLAKLMSDRIRQELKERFGVDPD